MKQGSPPGENNESVLVAAACRGERDAFDALIQRYQKQVTGIAYRLLGNLDDALEVAQETFVKAYVNLDSLDHQNRFAPWLLRIATNLALNARRSRATRKRLIPLDGAHRDDEQPLLDRIPAPHYADASPVPAATANELAERVHDAIDQLTDAQRTALVLFSMEKLPQKEVAEIMNCSIEAVKWHVFQARKKMKTLLADQL